MIFQDVKVFYISRYDFTDRDTGQIIKGCKITYASIDSSSDLDHAGYKVNTVNLPYEKFDELKGHKFPFDAKVSLEISDVNSKPKCRNVEFIKN